MSKEPIEPYNGEDPEEDNLDEYMPDDMDDEDLIERSGGPVAYQMYAMELPGFIKKLIGNEGDDSPVELHHKIKMYPIGSVPKYFGESIYFRFDMDPSEPMELEDFYEYVFHGFAPKFAAAFYYGVQMFHDSNSKISLYTDDGIYAIVQINHPYDKIDLDNELSRPAGYDFNEHQNFYHAATNIAKVPVLIHRYIRDQSGYGYVEYVLEFHSTYELGSEKFHFLNLAELCEQPYSVIKDYYTTHAHPVADGGDAISASMTLPIVTMEYEPAIHVVNGSHTLIIYLRAIPVAIAGHKIISFNSHELTIDATRYNDKGAELGELEPFVQKILSTYFSNGYYESFVYNLIGYRDMKYKDGNISYRLTYDIKCMRCKPLVPCQVEDDQIVDTIEYVGLIPGAHLYLMEQQDWVPIKTNDKPKTVIGVWEFDADQSKGYADDVKKIRNWVIARGFQSIIDIENSFINNTNESIHSYWVFLRQNVSPLQIERFMIHLDNPGSLLDRILNHKYYRRMKR